MITIADDEHVFVCGMTGSGKSYRARLMLRARAAHSRVLVIDPKNEFWVPGAKVVRRYSRRHRVQIYRPDLEDGALEEVEQYDALFRAVWRDGRPITVYVDELNATLPGPQSCLRSLERLYRQGRSRRITVWASTQRPKDIPSLAFTESTHILSFWLNWAADAEKVETFTYRGVAAQIAALDWHHALYCCPRRRQRLILPPDIDTHAETLTPTPARAESWLATIGRWLGINAA